MALVNPLSTRHMARYLGDSLEITIPSRRMWFQFAFLGFWLVCWTVGEVLVGGTVLPDLVRSWFGIPAEPGASGFEGGCGVSFFLVAWFCGWTLAGAFAWYAFLWQLVGKEVVRIGPRSIVIIRQILILSRAKEYLAEHIRDLRISPQEYSPFGPARYLREYGLAGGTIAFDYGAKTLHFASGVDEAEAKQILATIQERFPLYATGQQSTNKR